ncbi:unnamed protein product [Mortierella alpina]
MADDDNGTATSAQPSSPKLYYIKEARAKAVPQQLTGSHDLMTTDLPGKNVIRPGNYIRALLEAPEKGYGPIHSFSTSTLRDAFSLRPGPVPGFDSSVLGTEEETMHRNVPKNPTTVPQPPAADSLKSFSGNAIPGQGPALGYTAPGMNESPAHSSHGHHHHHHGHSHSHTHHGSKSSTSSPHVDRAERAEDSGREHRHKKKKKKRKHEHDTHEHGHHEGEGDSEHRKKKKRKKEREEYDHGNHGDHGEIDIM